MEPGVLTIALQRDDAAWGPQTPGERRRGMAHTVRADGMPQSSVISFLWDGDTIFFYSKPDAPKLRNIARSPLISFQLQSDPCGGHLLIIEGTAELDPGILPSDAHEAYTAKYREPFVHWGLDEAETALDCAVPIRITPRRVRTA